MNSSAAVPEASVSPPAGAIPSVVETPSTPAPPPPEGAKHNATLYQWTFAKYAADLMHLQPRQHSKAAWVLSSPLPYSLFPSLLLQQICPVNRSCVFPFNPPAPAMQCTFRTAQILIGSPLKYADKLIEVCVDRHMELSWLWHGASSSPSACLQAAMARVSPSGCTLIELYR